MSNMGISSQYLVMLSSSLSEHTRDNFTWRYRAKHRACPWYCYYLATPSAFSGRSHSRSPSRCVSFLLPAFHATIRLPITIHLTSRARTGATLLLGHFQIGFVRADFHNLDTEFSLPRGRIYPTLRSLLRRFPNREEGVEERYREKEREREREREKKNKQFSPRHKSGSDSVRNTNVPVLRSVCTVRSVSNAILHRLHGPQNVLL